MTSEKMTELVTAPLLILIMGHWTQVSADDLGQYHDDNMVLESGQYPSYSPLARCVTEYDHVSVVKQGRKNEKYFNLTD